MQAVSPSALADLIDRAERADAPLDAALVALAPSVGGNVAPLRAALVPLAQSQLALVKANADIALVADELRRYQKYALPGKPSLQIVQLRKQQATVKQAALIARQNYAQATHAFLRDSGLTAPARRTPTDFTTLWLGKVAAALA
ncbi:MULTISPECIES: hypothetical protein [Stenotrophomonas]|jgi:hypothetical protein|uniref:Uncharacterized protein n=1 Tax=Stenotrophomonas maltophilia TaxID=40324 RepID=A0A4S2D3S8_STEMA|nr:MULTISPECIES: hypothetical protein [Stenotrophomonas]MBD3828791.1 hypothetical protein [Stenotrophomonas sp.]TGY35755.1 hypothetical protein E5352_03820 [Stenotrophomonas maltophilia]